MQEGLPSCQNDHCLGDKFDSQTGSVTETNLTDFSIQRVHDSLFFCKLT